MANELEQILFSVKRDENQYTGRDEPWQRAQLYLPCSGGILSILGRKTAPVLTAALTFYWWQMRFSAYATRLPGVVGSSEGQTEYLLFFFLKLQDKIAQTK